LVLSRITAIWQLYALMLVTGVTGPATFTLPYLRALSLWLSRRRGLAIGLAAAGIALGAATIPLGLQKISALHGWSVALVTFALFELLVCLPLAASLVRDDPASFGLGPDGDAVPFHAGTPAAAPVWQIATLIAENPMHS
jgi:nitrate/nitrite transporter NarK